MRGVMYSHEIAKILSYTESNLFAHHWNKIQRHVALESSRSIHNAAFAWHKWQVLQSHQIWYLHQQIGSQGYFAVIYGIENRHQTVDVEWFWADLCGKFLRYLCNHGILKYSIKSMSAIELVWNINWFLPLPWIEHFVNASSAFRDI